MKKIAILLFMGAIFSCSYSQSTNGVDIPEAVKTAFQKLHPEVKSVKWDKEGDKYEASFDFNKKDQSILFDKNGNVEETEVEINSADLPQTVMDYIEKNYRGQTILEAAMITDAGGTIKYEAEIKGKDLIFDADGTFLKELKH